MSFKQFLADSTAITAGNVGSLAKLHSDALKGTKEFESITKLDPNFAKKLLVAWEGDARDYEKNKKIDSLFMKMIQPDAIKKMSKLRLDDLTHEIVDKLALLHKKAMPNDVYKPKFVDKSVWSHERLMKEYAELRLEVESILMEAKTLKESQKTYCVIVVFNKNGSKYFNTVGTFDTKQEADAYVDKQKDSKSIDYRVEYRIPQGGTNKY